MLESLPSWCGAPDLVAGGIGASLFAAGLVASPLHCAPMCGGFVLGQVADRMARLPGARLTECQRLRAAGLAPYHLGRITTYIALGCVAGGGGLLLRQTAGGTGLFLLIGAALLALQAARTWRPGFALPLTQQIRGYRLGLALGFLPCGILYAALAAAAATGNPVLGGLAMLCFGLGTVPVLVLLGYMGAAGARRFGRGLARMTPAILLFNAGLLTMLGLRMLTGS